MAPDFELQGSAIFIGPVEHSFPQWLAGRGYSKLFVLTDAHTAAHCFPVFRAFTGAYSEAAGNLVHFRIPAGEAHKNLDTCGQIWQAFQAAALDRQALVVNLGGGVVGDIGGFCAAVWKRGIDFVQAPTSLLAMTDAAIGGKTGVDFQGIKNLIGVFKQPAAVFADTGFLKTLPERELKSGLAEIIKHFAISGQLSNSLDDLKSSVEVKVRIVQQDPRETGLRMLLNFGHTIGHALESFFLKTDSPLTHGEAVAVGMICETRILTEKQGAPAYAQPLEKIISEHFRFPSIPPEAAPELWSLMLHDKKNASGSVRMALPDAKPLSLKTVETNQGELKRSLMYFKELFT